jgi:hypothetical protein
VVPASPAARAEHLQEYGLGELESGDGVLTTPDGFRVACFKGSEGNIILAIGEA